MIFTVRSYLKCTTLINFGSLKITQFDEFNSLDFQIDIDLIIQESKIILFFKKKKKH